MAHPVSRCVGGVELPNGGLVVGLLSIILSAGAALAEPATVTEKAPSAARPMPPTEALEAATRPRTPQEFERWHESILKLPRPKGCFTAHYPDERWVPVPCKAPPRVPLPPSRASGFGLDQVGDGADFSAVAPSGHIIDARGSFDPATNVTSECDVPCPLVAGQITCPVNPTCTGHPSDTYSLQLNAKPFTTSTCNLSPTKSACQGWEQFVYESSGSGFMQYWLEHYGPAGTACPAPQGQSCVAGEVSTDGWCPFSFKPGGEVYCVVNAPNGVSPPHVPASQLTTLELEGAAAGFNGSADDSIVVTVKGQAQPFLASGNNYFPDLGSQLNEFEFNVFGAGSGSQAVFNSGATVAVRSGLNYGGSSGPDCDDVSFTGESSNLTLNNVAPAAAPGPSPALPALLFTEVNPAPAGGAATCANATSMGDTHLIRFDGLKYDFQATGDFLLVQSPNLTVHTRQQRAVTDPKWIPNASINKAVAAQIGPTRVELYIWPVRLMIDGKQTDLANGQSVLLPTGVRVIRRGDVYIAAGPQGSVRATVNNNNINQWIDVQVGFGHVMPAETSGLLGVPKDKSSHLVLAKSAVLSEVTFATLYKTFRHDWEVPRSDALLRTELVAKPTAPEKPLYASDLDPASAERGRAACAAVTDPTLLEDCILDAAVLGDATPAKAFAHAIVPRAALPHLKLEVAPR